MEGHLFRDRIVTEGAVEAGRTEPSDKGYYTEFYLSVSQKTKVAILVDPEDDEYDSLTMSTYLDRLELDQLVPVFCPNLEEELKGKEVKSIDPPPDPTQLN